MERERKRNRPPEDGGVDPGPRRALQRRSGAVPRGGARRGSFATLVCCALAIVPMQAQDSPPVGAAQIGTPLYFAVSVAELERSVAWYRDVFGLEPAGGSAADDGSWRIENLRNERLFVELILDGRAQSVDRARGLRKVGFEVPDVEVIAARIEQSTGTRPRIVEDPRFGMRILQLRDPDGNVVQLSSTAGAREDAD